MKILKFVNETKEKVINRLLEASVSGECTRETIHFKAGQADIAVIRGGAVEKASVTHLELKQVQPPGIDKPVDATVFQMEIFPENPYCPMGHFNTEWSISQTYTYHMNLDLFPAVFIEEDLKNIKQSMDAVAGQFGLDKDRMRDGLDQHYNMDHFDAPLSSKVGCKLLELKDEQVDLFITAYHTFFNSYIEILNRRKDTPYNDADKKMKLKRNGKWLEYITLKDRAVRMAVATGIPPEILIKLSYPPSAIF